MVVIEVGGHHVHVRGRLEGLAARFDAVLLERGFTAKSRVNQLRLLGHLSSWLESEGLDPTTLTVEQIEAFLGERRRTHTGLFSRKALGPLLVWLADAEAIPVEAAGLPKVEDPPELASFEQYLREERRLAESTIVANLARARRFVAGYLPAGGVGALSAVEVTRALLDEGATRRPVSVKAYGCTLRALLRFWFITGVTDHDLSAATLVVRASQPSRLPVGASAAEVAALLASCDRATPVGRRDYAVLLLLARLGLRAVEVARLGLADLDWRRGEVLVRGKGNRDERLPLPEDVGAAIVNYLQTSRAANSGVREVFEAARAPRRALTREAVGGIVERACDRAGVPRSGPHRLRHTLGEQMVAAEVSLDAIGQVLRHARPLTTAGYARVDVAALRGLVQPWPTATSTRGGVR